MSRLVEARRPARAAGNHQESLGGDDGGAGGDNFIDRVVKYIPGEILAAYMTLDRVVAKDAAEIKEALIGVVQPLLTIRQSFDYYLPHILFFGLLIATPLYIYGYARLYAKDAPWRLQAFVAMIAFAVWAYAMRGSYFVMNDYFVDKYAALLVPFFTIASGFFRPAGSTGVDLPAAPVSGAVVAPSQVTKSTSPITKREFVANSLASGSVVRPL